MIARAARCNRAARAAGLLKVTILIVLNVHTRFLAALGKTNFDYFRQHGEHKLAVTT